MTDWSKLPDWIDKQIEESLQALTADHVEKRTIQLRERIKVLREIKDFGKEATAEPDLFAEFVVKLEETRGYV